MANRLHFLAAQTFLFCFHCGAISTLAPKTRAAIFSVKHVSLHSSTFITTILVESFMIGYTPGSNWEPITLFSKSIFRLVKKNLRDLVVGNNNIQEMKFFSKVYGANPFSTRLISCVIILASLVCFLCFNSGFMIFTA